MIEAFEDEYGVEVLHGWGMTEMSPVGAVCGLNAAMTAWPVPEQRRRQAEAGPGDLGRRAQDRRRSRQAAAARRQERRACCTCAAPGSHRAISATSRRSQEAFDGEGWFSTGDVATIDPHGYMQITDRAKDMVRSGGEWISSIELENAAVGHPGLAEAAVIAAPHPKWGERPLLVAVRRPEAEVDQGRDSRVPGRQGGQVVVAGRCGVRR